MKNRVIAFANLANMTGKSWASALAAAGSHRAGHRTLLVATDRFGLPPPVRLLLEQAVPELSIVEKFRGSPADLGSRDEEIIIVDVDSNERIVASWVHSAASLVAVVPSTSYGLVGAEKLHNQMAALKRPMDLCAVPSMPLGSSADLAAVWAARRCAGRMIAIPWIADPNVEWSSPESTAARTAFEVASDSTWAAMASHVPTRMPPSAVST